MENRSFEKDLEESNSSPLRKEWIRIFKKIFGEEIEISFKDEKNIQLGLGMDVTIKQKNGRRFSVEYKTKPCKYMNLYKWPLELKSHRYSDKEKTNKINSVDGWLYTSTAEYIIFGTLNDDKNKIIEVMGYSLTPFKNEEFKSKISKLETRTAPTYFNNGIHQTTIFALAHKDWYEKHANKFWYWNDLLKKEEPKVFKKGLPCPLCSKITELRMTTSGEQYLCPNYAYCGGRIK